MLGLWAICDPWKQFIWPVITGLLYWKYEKDLQIFLSFAADENKPKNWTFSAYVTSSSHLKPRRLTSSVWNNPETNCHLNGTKKCAIQMIRSCGGFAEVKCLLWLVEIFVSSKDPLSAAPYTLRIRVFFWEDSRRGVKKPHYVSKVPFKFILIRILLLI